MKKGLIFRQYTVGGYLAKYMWPLIVLVMVFLFLPRPISQWSDKALYTAIGIIIVWLAYLLERRAELNKRLLNRTKELESLASDLSGDFRQKESAMVTDFGLMSLSDMEGQKDKDYFNFLATEGWTYCDYSYADYNRTKYGDYKTYTEYYGVMTAQLPRELPNVFFDSLTARKRQFRFHFSRRQRHSLEGNFDQYFATYFPTQYTIDSMSFISPDVMMALIDASDYDIEIRGNRVYLYGPLYNPKDQIKDMASKLAVIKKELLDNIVTYRDERLPYGDGRQRVTLHGAKLERSKFLARLSAALIIVYVIIRVVIEIWAQTN